MTTDIVIKSYPPDFQFLAYCLKSIAKYATGFRNIILIVPPNHGLTLTREQIVEVPGPESYLYQQVCKLNADHHTDADFILHVDSDTCFTKPVTPETFMDGSRVRWLVTPMLYEPQEVKKAWLHVMVRCVQEWPEFEFMRKATMMIPRWAYREFRIFIQGLHGMSMDTYVMNCPNREFSEYNCLGLYLFTHHQNRIKWHCCMAEPPDKWEFQSHSWGGMTDEIRDKLEAITA